MGASARGWHHRCTFTVLLLLGLLTANWASAQLPTPPGRRPGGLTPGGGRPGGPPGGGGRRGAPPGRGGGTSNLDGRPDEPKEPKRPAGEPYEPTIEAPPAPNVPKTICHGKTIRKIEVQGARRVEDDDIRATMDLRRGGTCTDTAVAKAARKLWNLGFFDDIVIEATKAGEEKVDLLVRVVERPAIGRVVYEGNDEIEKKKIKEKVNLREGTILSVPDVEKQVDNIRQLYAKKGFFLAEIDYELEGLSGDNNEVEVRFKIDEGQEVTVRRVQFVGNDSIPADELQKIMQTSETGFFSFLTSNDTFNRDAFDQDLTRLQAYYYDKGYLAMKLSDARVELTPDRQHIDVTIPIEEGPRFKIDRLSVAEVNAQGKEVKPLGGREWIQEEIQADEGDWFSRSDIAKSLQSITRFYRDRGYAKAEIVPQTNLSMEEETVDVTVQIQRGPLVRIERINIQGNSKTRDSVIRRELEILEGELYSQTKIEQSKRRINALGYFERVDVSEERGSAPDKLVLNFEVAERATGTFQVGFGFSSIESVILTAQIQQQNLFGRGQSLQLNLQISGIRQNAQLRLTEPYLFGTPWSLSVNAFKTIRQFQDFTRDSTGGGITLGHPIFDDRLRFFVRYRAEMVDIQARTGGFFGRGSGAGFNIFRTLPLRNLFRDGLTSSLRFSLTWDSRNNRLFPSDGIHASVSSEIADSYLGSENVFVRNEGFFRFFQRIWGPFVLRLNTEVGLITSRSNQGVPIFERYFLGGIFDMRGFQLNGLGPRAGLQRSLDPTAPVPSQGVVIGGNLQAYYNLEIQFPILEAVGIKGVIFTDGGNAWNLEDNLCEAPVPEQNDPASNPCGVSPHMRFSWGFGFRWFSPLGPLRFEWGLPFNPREHESAIQFEFTIGNFF